jgi:hypothetical protein
MRIAYLFLPIALASSHTGFAQTSADASKTMVAIDIFEQTCSDLNDYDALHSANLAKGWVYLGTEETPTSLLMQDMATKVASDTKLPALNKVAPIFGQIMGALASQGHHRRVYKQEIDGRKFFLIQTFTPGLEHAYGPQVNCTVHAQAPEGLPTNEKLFAQFGGKPNFKKNFNRKPSEPIGLRWQKDDQILNIVYSAPGVPLHEGKNLVSHDGVISLTKAKVTNKPPADGDPEVEPLRETSQESTVKQEIKKPSLIPNTGSY